MARFFAGLTDAVCAVAVQRPYWHVIQTHTTLLAKRIIGLPPPFLLACFIFGLAPDIRREVQAHQPLTLVQAAGLASL